MDKAGIFRQEGISFAAYSGDQRRADHESASNQLVMPDS